MRMKKGALINILRKILEKILRKRLNKPQPRSRQRLVPLQLNQGRFQSLNLTRNGKNSIRSSKFQRMWLGPF